MSQDIVIYWIQLTNQDQGILQRPPQAVTIAQGSTIKQALALIGLSQQADVLLNTRSVAVFGQYALPDTVLHEGDRIEILDTLRFDPKESRRRRAEHKLNEGTSSKAAPRRSKKRN